MKKPSRKNRKERWMKGSFTIEAAVVLPVVLYVLLLVVYSALYLYSSYTLSLGAYISAFRGSRANLLKEDGCQAAARTMQGLTSEKLPAVENVQYMAEGNLWKNSVEAKTKIQIPFMQPILQKRFAVQIKRESGRIDPAFFLRNCRKVKALYEERRDT